jgi:hypothetical protein
MREHGAIGSGHRAFVAVEHTLLAHHAWLTGGWTDLALGVGKDEQPAALHLVPDEPSRIIHGAVASAAHVCFSARLGGRDLALRECQRSDADPCAHRLLVYGCCGDPA